ncbi:hypothetical protein SLEP1_g35440 [Rubroshorea leprosula]|uniref:Uncharacterized protein n=1 Tax=Rubroshorea leprosula TaxID=152421 RepID=A0AAV5KN90_9ROSI|nr:hypothetical protein SLEP1_g35440 [Rubroshorea leprosula]
MSTRLHGAASPFTSLRMAKTGISMGIFDRRQILPPSPFPVGNGSRGATAVMAKQWRSSGKAVAQQLQSRGATATMVQQ